MATFRSSGRRQCSSRQVRPFSRALGTAALLVLAGPVALLGLLFSSRFGCRLLHGQLNECPAQLAQVGLLTMDAAYRDAALPPTPLSAPTPAFRHSAALL